MIYTYKIYLKDNFLGYEYAMTDYSARQKTFNKLGSASRFTSVGMENIRAVRIN